MSVAEAEEFLFLHESRLQEIMIERGWIALEQFMLEYKQRMGRRR